MMGCKLVRCSAEVVLSMLKHGVHDRYEVISDAMPDDAAIREVRFSYAREGCVVNEVELVVESDTFDDVPSGFMLPMLTPTFRTVE